MTFLTFCCAVCEYQCPPHSPLRRPVYSPSPVIHSPAHNYNHQTSSTSIMPSQSTYQTLTQSTADISHTAVLVLTACLWHSITSCQQPSDWSVLDHINCFSPWQPVVLHRLHPQHLWSPQWSLPVHGRRGSQTCLAPWGQCASNNDRCRAWIISLNWQWLVGQVLNFISGHEVIALNGKKQMDSTGLIMSASPSTVIQHTATVDQQLCWLPLFTASHQSASV